MLKPISDLPKGVIGFSAEGTVTDADYKNVLIPSVEDALKSGGKIRFLYVLGPDFRNYAPGAMWDDTLFGARHYFDFDRIACVTDHEVYAAMIRSFGVLMPAAVRVFAVKELEAAKTWLAE
jgi:SpoIIAA-like